MKEYKIILDKEVSEVYEEIAKICNKPKEIILQDTLLKVIETISSKFNEGHKN